MINMYMNILDGSYVSENIILKKFSISSKGFQCFRKELWRMKRTGRLGDVVSTSQLVLLKLQKLSK